MIESSAGIRASKKKNFFWAYNGPNSAGFEKPSLESEGEKRNEE